MHGLRRGIGAGRSVNGTLSSPESASAPSATTDSEARAEEPYATPYQLGQLSAIPCAFASASLPGTIST